VVVLKPQQLKVLILQLLLLDQTQLLLLDQTQLLLLDQTQLLLLLLLKPSNLFFIWQAIVEVVPFPRDDFFILLIINDLPYSLRFLPH
jgi:hypothetical protein